jgi:hypothetical protein
MTAFSCRRTRTGRTLRAFFGGWLAAVLVAAAACDGGTGPSPQPDPQNPVPAISGLDPAAVLQYSDSVTVTVAGSGFVSGAEVRLNGTARPTAYGSPSQLTAVVPVAAMQEPAAMQVTVFNPAPGGGESAPVPLPVQHRVPTIRELLPGGSMQGDSAFVLAVEGTGFARASVVRWNGADRPTTFVDPYHVTARIAAADLDSVGTAQVTVVNPAPGGGAAEPRGFAVVVRPNPLPTLTDLAPDTVLVETGGTMTVTGTGFMAGTSVRVGGLSPAPTLVSPTELRFVLEPGNVPNSGFALVRIFNPAPGGGGSASLLLTVANPRPAVVSASPAQATVGADSQVVRLTGTGIVRGTTAHVNGNQRTARRISPTELEVVLTAGDLVATRTLTVTVSNPQPGGGGGGISLPVVNPVPAISSVAPGQVPAGQDSVVVRVTGSGFLTPVSFVPGTEVRLDGSPREARYVSRTEMEVVLTGDDLSRPGTYALTAFNPQPGGGSSAPASITVTAAVPVITTLPSNGATAGGAGYTLMVHGTGFVRGSRIRWNGADRTTRWVSGTRLEMDVAAADVATPRSVSVTVHTPGAGTSNAAPITVRTPGSARLTDLRLGLPAGGIAYDRGRDRLYASLGAGSGARANTVVAIDPHTGAITGSVQVEGEPRALALSDDGTALWVALDSTRQVLRLSLPGLVPGTRFSTGEHWVEEMRVMPGSPGTVVASLRNRCCSPSHEGVAMWDDGVRRPRGTPDHTGANSIVFGETADVLYGYDKETSPTHLYTLEVRGDGVSVARVSTDALSLGRATIAYAGGRVYNASGFVADAARHEFVTYIPDARGQSSVAVDAELGRVYFAGTSFGDELQVYDINTFELLGSDYIDAASQHPVNSVEVLLRWGTDGLVLIDGSEIHIMRMGLAGP